MVSTLTGSHKDTYQSIFQHPVTHNLEWKSLIAVFNQLGEVEEESNGKLKFTRNGQVLTIHVHGKEVCVDEVMHIRHFLDASASPVKGQGADSNDVVVVLDHKGAHIYQAAGEDSGAIHLVPEDPSGHDQQVHNPMGDSGGKQGPTRKLFYESVAQQLADADHILMVGDGEGASSEVEHFVTGLMTHHHKDIGERIIGCEVVDLHHLSEADLLAKSRELFALRLASFSLK